MNFLKDLSIDKIQNLAEDVYNSAKPKTDVEARVFEVLSHKNWGASSSLMNEIARDTYDMERFQVVSTLMWEGMENQRPAAWKVVFKSLNLLEHLVKNGAERCVDDARNHGHVLRSLGQFNYYEGTIDRGLGVREKSKQVLEMLSDDERVREERQKARKLREKFGNFNKGSSGMGSGGGGGGSISSSGGYGNQDSWNTGGSSGGYGEGGIYDDDKAFSGRYGNSTSTSTSATPTFASIPGEKKKSKKKKKSKQPKEEPVTVSAPAPAAGPAAGPVEDLLGFDDVPAPSPAPPVPAAAGNADFGAFQGSSAPTTTATDDFAEFDQIRLSKGQGPDPFAAAPVATQQQTASFDAFGNNSAASTNDKMINNNMMNNNMMNNNMMNSNMTNSMAAMGNAFSNMSVGMTVQPGVMQQPTMPSSNDDDFGDFEAAETAPAAFVAKKVSSDPLASLINLDGLSKNPSKKMTMNQPVAVNAAAAQYQQDMQNGVQAQNQGPAVVSAGGSDAISSMMGPGVSQQQMGSNFNMNTQGASSGMPMNPQMQQQQHFSMNQGMQGGGMNNMMGGNAQTHGNMMYGNQMGGMQGAMMNNTNMGMNQMGGQMNQMNPQMMGGMGMQGGMNQMGGMQGGMNQMNGMQGGMNQMGGMGMHGGMNQMGGNMMGNMGMQGGMGGQQSFR